MAKKKILKLTDEQYYKYILSLKNGGEIEDIGEQNTSSEALKINEDEKKNKI